MENSGAILCQISSLKDMLDQVNEEIEKNIEITRDIESEIVKCEEIESAFSARESELIKAAYALQFEIHGLLSVRTDSESSVKFLKDELCNLKTTRYEIRRRINSKREGFINACLDFQKDITTGGSDESEALLSEKESIQNEIQCLNKRSNALQNSMQAFVEEVLEDLGSSISALQVEIRCKKMEKEKLLKDIDELKATVLSVLATEKFGPSNNLESVQIQIRCGLTSLLNRLEGEKEMMDNFVFST